MIKPLIREVESSPQRDYVVVLPLKPLRYLTKLGNWSVKRDEARWFTKAEAEGQVVHYRRVTDDRIGFRKAATK